MSSTTNTHLVDAYMEARGFIDGPHSREVAEGDVEEIIVLLETHDVDGAIREFITLKQITPPSSFTEKVEAELVASVRAVAERLG